MLAARVEVEVGGVASSGILVVRSSLTPLNGSSAAAAAFKG